MALALGDARSGFRYSDILLFINEEVVSNGGGPDFYLTFCERPWNEIEDQLWAVLTNPQVPRPLKRACAWSALALGVRVAARQREQHARGVRHLQEQLHEHETASGALAAQLQQLRMERDLLVLQLGRVREDLQRALDEREAVRRQLLQAESRLQMESPLQRLRYAMWPPNVQEQKQVPAKMSQRRLDAGSQTEETQMASTTGVLCVPGLPDLQMPAGMTYRPGKCPAGGSQEEIVVKCEEGSPGQEEGPVGPHFINPSGNSRSQEEKQQPQGQVPSLSKGESLFFVSLSSRNLCEAEEALAPSA